ncbi:MAG: hypothetical protein WCA38_05875 [Candidatus Acidiferrales bacterium]
MSARWIPKAFHTITPNVVVDNAEQAVVFLTWTCWPVRYLRSTGAKSVVSGSMVREAPGCAP